MSTKKKRIPETISSLIESLDNNGNGILGFTIKYNDGSFDNIMQAFAVENKEAVLVKLTHELNEVKSRITKG